MNSYSYNPMRGMFHACILLNFNTIRTSLYACVDSA